MKDRKINELKNLPKDRLGIEEQLNFIQNITDNLHNHLEKMKKENPDVVEWIRKGKPEL
jgi:hypothetical protein